MKDETKLLIIDCDENLDHITDSNVEELHLIDLSILHGLDQLPALPRLKFLIIESCPNLISLEGLKTPKLYGLYISQCDKLRDYAPLNEIATLEYLTIHSRHGSLRGLRLSNPNLTVFMKVEDENGSYRKCFQAKRDWKLDNFLRASDSENN